MQANKPEVPSAVDPDWWRGAVIYQIYPRSYQDSNGDGVGDLTGIRERLGHVRDLGADAIWISPFFRSPMKDFGYDVSDYIDVDPLFGDLEAFDAMVSEAHALGIKVIIDLVLSHTSDQHPWFRESVASRDNARHDWYVWSDARPDGSPPNNWLSIFGGSAWSWNATRCQYYLHNFLESQPDLNFHNRDVQDALLDVARFWLDRGVDGFRLDTINFYFCDQQLRDNPALAPELRNADTAPAVNPYNYQDHLYDKSQPENLAFLERFRALLDEYPAATTVGEIGDAQYSTRLLREYTAGSKRVHMCYTFDFLTATRPDAARIATVLNHMRTEAGDAWICWAFSNHDVMRHATRWNVPAALEHAWLRHLLALLLSMRGSACLYQGEELALHEADIPFDKLQDPYGIAFWPDFKGRDGCRTPMVWRDDVAWGGFSDIEPWLPVPGEHLAHAVNVQAASADSMLATYRQLIAFRHAQNTLVKGEIERIEVRGDVLSFVRRLGNESLFCVFNVSQVDAIRVLDDVEVSDVLHGHGFESTLDAGELRLPPYGAAWLRLG